MVFLLIAENLVEYDIWCWSKNGSTSTTEALTTWPLTPLGKKPCRWNSRLAICNVIGTPTEFALTDATGTSKIMVRTVRSCAENHPVGNHEQRTFDTPNLGAISSASGGKV